MKSDNYSDTELQRRYYAETASEYDAMHLSPRDEHYFALCIMLGGIDFLGVRSILEIGAGTGRALSQIRKVRPDIVIRGIEPVRELREIAYAKGIRTSELTYGDALELEFERDEFDLVCEFGVLHHIRRPERAVAEMLRVAKKAIFISDSNNFGQGAYPIRVLKQFVNFLGLWPLANLIKTRGRGYSVSEGDGVAYSYSVFSNYGLIDKQCKSVHLFNTVPAAFNLYRTSGHVALMGIK